MNAFILIGLVLLSLGIWFSQDRRYYWRLGLSDIYRGLRAGNVVKAPWWVRALDISGLCCLAFGLWLAAH
jgi:hypothetical protein